MRLSVLALLTFPLLLNAQAVRPRPAPSNAPARLRQMDPKQRQKLLQSLPPDRRKQAADRLDRLDSLPPEERRELERRWELFRQMSPEDREKARNVFRDFNALPEDRRAALTPEFERLRGLSPAERTAYLERRETKKHYSKRELQILRRYSEVAGPLQP